MFEKKDKEMKLVDKDIGFAEDSFENLKQCCGEEAHRVGNFVIEPNNENFNKMNLARSKRTELMELIIKSVNAEVKNQDWCLLKHISTQAMHFQELMVRFSSIGNLESAKKCAEFHKGCYLEYLNLLGFTQKNISNETSA